MQISDTGYTGLLWWVELAVEWDRGHDVLPFYNDFEIVHFDNRDEAIEYSETEYEDTLLRNWVAALNLDGYTNTDRLFVELLRGYFVDGDAQPENSEVLRVLEFWPST